MNDIEKNSTAITDNTPEEIEIIGVRFKDAGKIYYFDPAKIKAKLGDCVIVETARGLEYGFVAEGNHTVSSKNIVQPLRRVIRIADKKDAEQYERNKELEFSAMEICRKKIDEHKLEMKLIDAEYTFDNNKVLF